MTFDPTPLLKGFGAAADVAGQIATDKAINGRRNSKGETQADGDLAVFARELVRSEQDEAIRADALRGNTDITDGQLIEDHDLSTGTPSVVPHDLGRVPVGAICLKSNGAIVTCAITTSTTVTMTSGTLIVSLWIF